MTARKRPEGSDGSDTAGPKKHRRHVRASKKWPVEQADIEEIFTIHGAIRMAARQLDWAAYSLKDAIDRLSPIKYRIGDTMRKGKRRSQSR